MESRRQADRGDQLRRVRGDGQVVDALVPRVRRGKDRTLRGRGKTQGVRTRAAQQHRACGQREHSLHAPHRARDREAGKSLYGVAGRSTVTCVPSPTSLATEMLPPCCSTSAREIARPSPVPGIACCVAVEARKNRENTCPCSSLGMPIPLSATTSATSPFRRAISTRTAPPAFVNLTAFETRLSST